MKTITIIAAIARNNEIGRKGDLLWHIPADLRHFKTLTQGSTVIMGRKTWESLPKRPLPKRCNIVVTGNRDYEAPGAVIAHSLQEALEIAANTAVDDTSSSRIFIIGGGSIYSEAMPLADKLEITHIDAAAPDADTFFPAISPQEWKLISESAPEEDSTAPSFTFRTYERK